jgi:hypothetical protein
MDLDACDRGELSGERPQQISGLLKFDNNSFKGAERELGILSWRDERENTVYRLN